VAHLECFLAHSAHLVNMIEIPELLTPRLRLRAYRPEDLAPFMAHLTDPAASQLTGTVDARTAWRVFLSHAGLWVVNGAGWWTVTLRDSCEAVGHVGAFSRDGFSDGEIGWSTYGPYRGKGIATEAATAALRHAFDVHRWPRVTALIDEGNTPSIRVAERLGLSLDGSCDLYGKQVLRYALERPPA
jgi:RimJ/RimL family protein N-acetyltransferase